MKKEYDFSKGARGKFYRPKAQLNLPIYLDADNLRFVMGLAERRRSGVGVVVNKLIRSDRMLAKTMG